MRLRFAKMQGLGNDFVVIDAIRQTLALSPAQARLIADRHFGIGCDQILVVEAPRRAGVDFAYRIFNADGGEVEQCGNGARCFVRFVHDQGLSAKPELCVDTLGGTITLRLQNDGQVSVDMGAPRFLAEQIPFIGATSAAVQALEIGSGEDRCVVDITALSMGNPHAVQVVAAIEQAPVARLGPLIESHPRFPQRVNAGFMQVMDRHTIRLRVYERGAGETLACGTGACAAAVAGIRRELLESPVQVHMHGGQLSIAWAGGYASVTMTGPAQTVFVGEIECPEAPPEIPPMHATDGRI